MSVLICSRRLLREWKRGYLNGVSAGLLIAALMEPVNGIGITLVTMGGVLQGLYWWFKFKSRKETNG